MNNISWLTMFLPSVPENNLFNAIWAATELGITVLTSTLIYPGARITNDYLREMLRDRNIKYDSGYLEGYICPMGRARKKLSSNFFIPEPSKNIKKACKEAGSTIVVLY
ncbi:hypothetical protein ABDB91_03580 [Desulfoscipio sp. XC116]|uniref:hypothetical protein n=1 Tax=Desulfoscipio sp. XC116 TaxID=3144975 RepID=UPI00325B5761